MTSISSVKKNRFVAVFLTGGVLTPYNKNERRLLTMIREGELIVENDGAQRSFALAGGFADVTPEGVTVLAEAIPMPDTADAD